MRALSRKTLSFDAAWSDPLARRDLGDGERAKTSWLARLRWFALIAQVCALAPALALGLLEPADIGAYASVVVLVFGLNLAAILAAKRWPARVTASFLFAQMIGDLAALGFLLHLTRGCSNPLIALFYFHAALGPLLLGGRWNVAYLGALMLTLCLVCMDSQPMLHLGHGVHISQPVMLAAELFVVVVTWSLTTWFSSSANRLSEELAQMQRQRLRTDNLRALGAMAASFSHEFSTPLNTAKMRLDRLTRLCADVRGNRDLEASKAALDQCAATLRGLFAADTSRMGAGGMEEVELISFVQRVCERWSSDRPATRLSYQVDREGQQIRCRVPKLIFSRSLVDLLDNAAEASAADAAQIDVAIATDAQKAVVAIADRGRGCSRFVRERLGDPFISTRVGGSGLGLYTANALMESLGGVLALEDRERGGTVVTLTFPVLGAQGL